MLNMICNIGAVFLLVCVIIPICIMVGLLCISMIIDVITDIKDNIK